MSLKDALKNSKGEIFYGMHFCPGVAQYDNEEGSFKIFLNEDTIRKMNPTFAARPVFVEHVDEVDPDINEVRTEADGWVVESFFNQADGKTWAKFIIVSSRGLAAIRKGYRLSNAYIPDLINTTGVWNGVTYQKLVTGGEFEHLAIVKNPRYDESVVMTPDEFKAYNENLSAELKRIANSKGKKGDTKMKFNIFKRTKVENSIDLEGMIVELPKSKKEIALTKLINDHDAILNMNGYANGDHMVKLNDKEEMSVNDLVKKHMEACNELAELKKNATGEDGGEPGTGEDEVGDLEVAENEHDLVDETEDTDIGDRGGDKSLDNEEDDEDESAEAKKKKMKNEAARAAAKKIAEAKAKAARLKNAHLNARDELEPMSVDLAEDQVARGKARYGSKY